MANESRATDQIAESARETWRTFGEVAGDIQEQSIRFWVSPFENWSRLYNSQIKGGRAVTEAVMDQAQKQQEAFQQLSQEWANTYLSFFNPFAAFQQGARVAQRATQESIEAAGRNARQGIEQAGQAGQAARRNSEAAINNHQVEVTEAARKKAEEYDVDLSGIEGTGSEGRITVADVMEAAGVTESISENQQG